MKRAQSDINISFNATTTKNHIHMLSVAAHFISEAGLLKTIPLAVQELFGPATSENIAKTVKDILIEWQITDCTGFYISDNAPGNDLAVKILGKELDFDHSERRI